MNNWTATLMKILVLSASFGVTSAYADVGARKEPLRVDFNSMIEQGAQDNQALQRGVLEAAQPAAPVAETVPDVAVATPSTEEADAVPKGRRAIVDFIDMEVGVGNDAAVVDRR